MFWLNVTDRQQDYYVAFRGVFTLEREAALELRTLSSGWFHLWLDGEYLLEGPDRFPPAHPEYRATPLRLTAGRHTLAVQVHHLGIETRMLQQMPPFLLCELYAENEPLAIDWRARLLEGYRSQTRRINPELGWIEWCDTRQNPEEWTFPDFDDSSWRAPTPVAPPIGEPRPVQLGPVQALPITPRLIGEGPLAEIFGYELDDISTRFFLRDLECREFPAQGCWRRYDLGRVRLARPRFTLDLPAGAIVEFAYSEVLRHGRVAPYINWSLGPTCNLDHYVARGGVQEFAPLTPKGGRFVEIHIIAPPERVHFLREEFFERAYHDAPEGDFACGEPLLDRIWLTGVETYRACAEDALIDNPTRERGQWTGDVVTVGMEIASAAYADLRLCRRGLVQSAQCAREDGMIAGLCPGGACYLPTYAAQWTVACLRYWRLSGDRSLLEELYPLALRNLAAFERRVTDEGLLHEPDDFLFVDWGYQRNEGPADMAYNLHFLMSLVALGEWAEAIGRGGERARFDALAARIAGIVRPWLAGCLARGADGWETIGYHSAVLALLAGLFTNEAQIQDCLAYMKRHMLASFPNNPHAPRNDTPFESRRPLITPYFAHYAFPPLIERGEMDFVLAQIRTCWGWMLEGDRTTWLEVFDARWSQCHQWAGCPTWQLSRYALGLHPRFDRGLNEFEVKLIPGSLQSGRGRVPLPSGGTVSVAWRADTDQIHYRLETSEPISLSRCGDSPHAFTLPGGALRGQGVLELTLGKA